MKFFRALQKLSVALLIISGATFAADLEGVRFGARPDGTRIVVDLSGPSKPSVFLLENPYRVVLDVKDANWNASRDSKALGLVAGYRHGLFRSDTYRLVFDLASPAIVARSFALDPGGKYGHRYVLDLKPASESAFLKAVNSSKSIRIASSKPSVVNVQPEIKQARNNQKPLVVIDAGHGGPDPGTLGVLGVNEKVVTLSIAQKIKKQLEKTGRYRVRLTRTRDIFIPVRDRFKIARNLEADLFISVHADAIKNPKVRGGTVYTLSEKASDKEAARLAARENKSDLVAGLNLNETDDEVSTILIDLAQRETMNVSAQFAETLLPEMRQQIRMHKKGHRYANLGVLKAPDIPSVLIETGYLSNREDARLLASVNGQNKIAVAVQKGVDKFFAQMVALGR